MQVIKSETVDTYSRYTISILGASAMLYWTYTAYTLRIIDHAGKVCAGDYFKEEDYYREDIDFAPYMFRTAQFLYFWIYGLTYLVSFFTFLVLLSLLILAYFHLKETKNHLKQP